jgi:hypothetical protein
MEKKKRWIRVTNFIKNQNSRKWNSKSQMKNKLNKININL